MDELRKQTKRGNLLKLTSLHDEAILSVLIVCLEHIIIVYQNIASKSFKI